MKCRHCKEELAENVTVCPACGGDNTPNRKNRTVIIAAICCVAVVIGVIAMVLGLGGFSTADVGRVTNKANYTEADEVVKSKVDLVVATAGDAELTNGELQVLYWSMVYDFVSYTGDYATYFIDFTKPLSGQYYDLETNMTWEHFFLESALSSWLRYEVLTAEAEKAGFEVDPEILTLLDGIHASMEADLEKLGFASVDELIHNDFGNAATFEDYMSYMNIYYRGNDYFNALYESVEYTDADIQDYYNRFADQLISQGLGKEHGSKVTARHILIEPANSTEEALDAAKQKAQDIMDQWIAAGAKEADFADLAKAHSDCPSAADGGNLGAFSKGQMVKEFEDWCFADGRKSGDYGLVQTQYGWHIIYIVDNNPVWYNAAKSGVINERLQAMMAEMEKNYPMTVDFENIVLADALMHK